MSEEKKVDELVGSICEKLRKLFLHCAFINPDFIKGQISKHLEIPIEKVSLTCESSHTTIIVEKKQTSKTPIEYWVLNMIEC